MKNYLFPILALFALSYCGEAPESVQDENLVEPSTAESMEEDMTAGNTNLNLRLWNERIDFYARGNEPFWGLDMDFEKVFRFTTPEGPDFTSPPSDAALAQDAAVKRYRSVTEGGEIIVTLIEGECFDDMSGAPFTHKVRVSLKKGDEEEATRYEGCGRYVIPTGLHDIWALESMDGKPVDASNLPKGTPTLEFNTGDYRVLGHTGCNNLNGAFAIMGPGSLQFSQMASTKMLCPNAEVEDQLLKALAGQRLDMELAEGRLNLSKRGEPVAVFRKVD